MDLHVVNFDMEDFWWDYMEVFDGINRNAPTLGKYQLPFTVPTLSGNQVLINFITDAFFHHNGFRIEFTYSGLWLLFTISK